MSVYLPSPDHTTFVYDFEYKGRRYKGSTHQTTEADAKLVEAKKRLELRNQAGGIAVVTAADTPTFTVWAGTTARYQAQFIRRPDILRRTLNMVLAFFGERPKKPIGPAAVPRKEHAPRPYHNLRLGDPIINSDWLNEFELWMEARKLGKSARNSYLSACSDLYTCAMQPRFRKITNITTNPFAGIRRATPPGRIVTMTAEQILALVTHLTNPNRVRNDTAERVHIAHALCIAALAPKLRLQSILGLKWSEHLDDGLTTIAVDGKTGHQRVPVSEQLRGILEDIRAGQDTDCKHVITWRGVPVASIKKALRAAVEAVGMKWGSPDGVTFHIMRHSIATILADPDLVGHLSERLRADTMGHKELRTTQKYTHLNVTVQQAPHEAISAVLPGLRAVATIKPVWGKVGGPKSTKTRKAQSKPTSLVDHRITRKRA